MALVLFAPFRVQIHCNCSSSRLDTIGRMARVSLTVIIIDIFVFYFTFALGTKLPWHLHLLPDLGNGETLSVNPSPSPSSPRALAHHDQPASKLDSVQRSDHPFQPLVKTISMDHHSTRRKVFSLSPSLSRIAAARVVSLALTKKKNHRALISRLLRGSFLVLRPH